MNKNLLFVSALGLSLSLLAGPALSDEATKATVGGTAGGVTGAVIGGMIFGPLGAVIGGFTGATIGVEAGINSKDIEYVRLHPTEPVVIEGDVTAGYVVPKTVTIAAIADDPDYGYFYTKDRVYIVKMADRKVVYSPGTVVAVSK